MSKERKKKKVYEEPNIRELRLNVPKDMNKKELNEIINIITTGLAT